MEKYSKDVLIKEIAARADFTIGDVKIIWYTFEELVKEIIKEKGILFISGLFTLSVGEIVEHDGMNAFTKTRQHIKKSNRIKFKPSRTLYELFK